MQASRQEGQVEEEEGQEGAQVVVVVVVVGVVETLSRPGCGCWTFLGPRRGPLTVAVWWLRGAGVVGEVQATLPREQGARGLKT
jgi:hypothetical protein